MTGREYDQTLLIVESPSVARIIDSLHLPALQTWSSNGYCWKPYYNPKTGNLEPRVNPRQTEDRNQLKKLARWANRIIVATDTDPSGVFLAEAVRRFLKHHVLHRGYLTTLSRAGINHTVKNTSTLGKEDFDILQRRSYVRNRLCKSDELLWIRLSTIAFFTQNPYPLRFVDRKQRYWRCTDPDATGNIPVTVHNPEAWYPEPFSPPTTLCLLNSLDGCGNSFASAQNELEKAFVTSAREGFPISYPRSASGGWYYNSWLALISQLQKLHPAENLLPASLWSVCDEAEPHEALHVLNPADHSPAEVRPYVTRSHYLIYEKLHQHTVRALSAVPNSHPDPQDRLTPVQTTANWIRYLAASHACSPSSIGKITDRLLTGQLITIPSGSDEIYPGPHFDTWRNSVNPENTRQLIAALGNAVSASDTSQAHIKECTDELMSSITMKI